MSNTIATTSSSSSSSSSHQSSSSTTTTTRHSTINKIKTVNEIQDNNLQIFLGGSCNPTTWRQNLAIPFLETNGITYYNPQVDNWTPEVVNIERYAKQNAQVLLFVIDKQTRSTVSLVESAFMAGESKNLVLVIYPFEYNIIKLTDTTQQTSNVIETRSESMTTSRFLKKNQNQECSSFIRSSSSRSSSSSSKTSSSTLVSSPSSLTNQALKSSTCVSTATTSTSTNLTSKKISTSATKTGELGESQLEATHERAQQSSSSTIKINGEIISSSEFQELRQARYMLQNLVALSSIPMFSDILQALSFISSSLNDNIGRQKLVFNQRQSVFDEQYGTLDCIRHKLTSTEARDQLKSEEMKDVYLSLDSGDGISVESSVIPILQEKGLTYNYMFVNNIIKTKTMNTVPPPPDSIGDARPQEMFEKETNKANQLTKYSEAPHHDISAQAKSTIERAICAIKGSRVLLFVITNRCRGLSIMVLASHFMALFRDNVVLCLQYLEEPCLIGGEELTKAAIADYNRGRVYLSDYAIKSQVPVFSTIHEAIECCSRKCHFNNKNR